MIIGICSTREDLASKTFPSVITCTPGPELNSPSSCSVQPCSSGAALQQWCSPASHLPDEVEQQIQDSCDKGLHHRVELDCDINHVLQALCARLIQPRIHLSPSLLICEGGRICHLKQHNTAFDTCSTRILCSIPKGDAPVNRSLSCCPTCRTAGTRGWDISRVGHQQNPPHPHKATKKAAAASST